VTALVTGGAGFIGCELVRQLIDTGEPVVTVDRLTYAGNLANLRDVMQNPLHRFERSDVCDTARMRELLLEHRPRAIFHLAAESHVDRSIDEPLAFVRTNVLGTASLLEAARDYAQGLDAGSRAGFRFVHVSTDEVYGALGPEGVFTEASPYAPSSPYSASKAGADHLARAWCRTYGVPVVVSNCSNNYGPCQHPEKLIPLMILNALEDRPLPVYGEGAQSRDWLHVSDHADALRLVAERGTPGETYLVGARNVWRNIDLVKLVCAELDLCRPAGAPHTRLIEFVPDRPGHDLRYAIEPTKIEQDLGWRARVAFEAGLAQTVRWYIDHRDWCAEVSRSYGRERLGRLK
jgi:dTDP-glucose 4,6-dehydratase